MARQLACKNFAFFRLWMRRDITGCSAEYSAVWRRRSGQGRGRGGLVLEELGFNKIRDMHRSPLRIYVYIFAYIRIDTYIYICTQIYAMEWNRGRYQYARCATGRS